MNSLPHQLPKAQQNLLHLLYFNVPYVKLFLGNNPEVVNVQKKFSLILFLTLIISVLAGCKEVPTVDKYADYKNSMEIFFEEINSLDQTINALDPEDPDSLSELFICLDQIEEQFKCLSEIEVPAEFVATESLADEAYEYMVQANQYFRASFSDTSYNEYTYEAGLECYNRANKRLHYIVQLIHGEELTDENVTVQ